MTSILIRPSLCLICLFCLSCFAVFAQDIGIKVKKGTAKLGNNSLLETSPTAIMKSSDWLEVQPNALVVARQENTVIELVSGKKYTYTDIMSLLKKKKAGTEADFTSVAFKDPVQKNNPTPLQGTFTRGGLLGFNPDFFYPYDNMLVLDAGLDLLIGNADTKITSPVILKNKATGTVIYEGQPKDNRIVLSELPEGEYEWSYSIEYYTATDKVQMDFQNVFTVPAAKVKKERAKKLNAVKKQLRGFSPEMQEVLLLEYCVENGIYHKIEP